MLSNVLVLIILNYIYSETFTIARRQFRDDGFRLQRYVKTDGDIFSPSGSPLARGSFPRRPIVSHMTDETVRRERQDEQKEQ